MGGLLYLQGQVRKEAARVIIIRVVQPFALLEAMFLKQAYNTKKYLNRLHKYEK